MHVDLHVERVSRHGLDNARFDLLETSWLCCAKKLRVAICIRLGLTDFPLGTRRNGNLDLPPLRGLVYA